MKSTKANWSVMAIALLLTVSFVQGTFALSSSDVVSAWHFDNSAADAAGGNTLSPTSISYSNSTYKLGTYSAYFSGSGYFSLTQPANLKTAYKSVSVWVYPTTLTGTNRVIYDEDVSGYGVGLVVYANGEIEWTAWTDSGTHYYQAYSAVGTVTTGSWQNIVGTWDGTSAKIYYNGVDVTSSHAGTGAGSLRYESSAVTSHVGWRTGSSYYWIGYLDELDVADLAWNSTDVTELYNGGSGLAYPFAVTPTIVIASLSPLNTTFTSSTTPTFDANVSSIANTWNLSLIINGTSYGTYNSISSTGNYSIIPTSALTAGNLYQWWYNATSGSSSQITDKRDLYIIGSSCTGPQVKVCQFSAGSININGITCT